MENEMYSGIFTPIVTPFDSDGKIDFTKMDHNLERWSDTKLSGMVVAGSNGEAPYLTIEERLLLARHVVERCPKKTILLGTGCESTETTMALNSRAADLGVQGVLVLPPHYYKATMTEDVLFRYFSDLADASPISMLLYNIPGNTGIHLSAQLVKRLAKHEKIAGIKDTSGNIVHLSEMIHLINDPFSIFAGNASYLLPALVMGAAGGTLALANILPDDCCRLRKLYQESLFQEAAGLQLQMLDINRLVTAQHGIPGLKYALGLLGYKGGETRRPLLPLSREGKESIQAALTQYGALK
ncbi:MAG: dihydrodipicolinate synthase family protein [Desulfohalobiaceae bacterium]|nr:dihydrodipicolinate synthase family protein [Desulfohalobiaceae bacterium]